MPLKQLLETVPLAGDIMRIRSVIRSRRHVRRRVRQLQTLLAPGRYRIRWNLAERHYNVSSENQTEAHRLFLQHNADRALIQRIVELTPPRSVHVPPTPGREAAEGWADVLLVRGPCTLLLSHDGRHITRLFTDPIPVARIIDHWQRLHTSLAVPYVEPISKAPPGYHAIRETLMAGTTLGKSSRAQVFTGYSDFLRQCARNACNVQGCYGRRSEILNLLELPLPTWLQTTLSLRKHLLVPLLADSPALFCHADCHPANIVVLPNGGVGLIDLERAAWMPFFFDALYMLRMNNAIGEQLRTAYFRGDFDRQLGALWQAAGQTFRAELRLDYLLAVAIAHALRDQYRHDPPSKRVRKLEKPSRALRPYCHST